MYSIPGLQVIAGGIDNVVKIWDLRKDSIVYRMHGHQETISGMSLNHEGGLLLTNSIDGTLRVWDVRPYAPQERCVAVYQVRYSFRHPQNTKIIALSPPGVLLVGSNFNFSKISSQGHHHNFEKKLLRCAWSPDDKKITCGSADKLVNVWDCSSRRLLYKLPGHLGSVNEVQFHPSEPILLSVGSDKQIYLGEIEP